MPLHDRAMSFVRHSRARTSVRVSHSVDSYLDRPRLGSLSKADTRDREITSPCREEPVIESPGGLIQRCVIIQRDEKGYGLTVSGDNPVFVQSVKENGAAARAGVQQGDRIIKVNGTLVTNSNHVEVVKLIKSGSYVALTLLGRPSGHKTQDRITGPQPVDAEKEKEFESQKIITTRLMYEQSVDYCERIRKEYLHNPSDKLQHQLAEAQKTVSVIENQLQQLTNQEAHTNQLSSASTGSSTCSQSPDYTSQGDHPFTSPTTNHSSAFQMVYAPVPWGGVQSTFHQKSPSMPDTFYSADEAHHDPTVVRSHSDVTRSSSSQLLTASEVFHEENKPHKFPATSLPSTMSVSETHGTSSSFDSQSMQSDTNEDLHESGSEPSLKVMDSNDESSKLQLVSPNQVNIISMEDDDFASEEEQCFAKNSVQTFNILTTLESRPYYLHQALDDHGPFSDLSVLKNKPAHLAVVIHYLISNSDPSALFFYLVSENYSTGSQKEMRKWAYEIYSTFLLKEAPLFVVVDDSVLAGIEEILQNKYDKEDVMRNVFQPARNQVLNEVNELLADFRNKRALGLGSFYGDQALHDDNMDRNTELRHAEKCLAPDWETLVAEETDRSQAMASALSTFLRNLGITRVSNVNMVDRCSSFVTRDKRFFRIKSNKKIYSQKGHNFTANHYYSTVYCANCHKALWGIGNQGYQCINCEINIHKQCFDLFEEHCGKKNKKDRKSMLNFDRIRKPSSPNPAAIEKAKQLHHTHEDKDSELVTSPNKHSVFHIQPSVTEVAEEQAQQQSSRVGKLVDRYQGMNTSGAEPKSPDSSPRSRSPETTQVNKKEVSLSRSESLNNDRRLGTKVSRRTKSDVNVDEDTIKALSGDSNESSSASSLSNKSLESPSNSSEKLEQTAQQQSTFSSRFLNDSDLDVEPDMPTLEKTLPKDVLKKLKPKEKKRQEVINELFFTEKTHLRNLKILDQLFNKPMLMDSFVSNDLVRAVFPNLEEVIKVHKTLNEAMKKRHKESPLVPQVADLLLDRFDGPTGELFKGACATFIRNQKYALELLKTRQRKEPKLAQLLAEAESNPLCRRLQLKDLIPTEFHRLTKYPLLIENLMKYTSVNTPEHNNLSHALKLVKEIAHHVDQALKECENQNKLLELQRKLDRRSIENPSNPLAEYKNLDLTKHKLLFSGDLTWRLNKNKLIDVHVALLEDILVLLQKQDDRYVLKCQSTTVVADTKFTHSPIIKLSSLFLRINASDKRAFFLVSTSSLGPQIYDLVAVSAELRKSWFKNVTEAVDASKSSRGRRNAQVVTSPVSPSSIVPEKHVMIEPEKDKNENVPFDNAEEVVLVEETTIIQPKEVVVSNPAYTQSQHVASAIDFIKKKDTDIKAALEEKQKMVAKVMNIPVEHFETVAEVAGEVDGDKEPKELVLASILQLNRLTTLVNESIHPPGEDEGPAKGPNVAGVAAEKLVPITSSLNDYFSQLLALLSAKESEQGGASLSVVPSPPRPSSFISVGESSASEGSGIIDETALLFGFTPDSAEQAVQSKMELHVDEDEMLVNQSKVKETENPFVTAEVIEPHVPIHSTETSNLVTVENAASLPSDIDDADLSITEPVCENEPLNVNELFTASVVKSEPCSPQNILQLAPFMAETHSSEPIEFETLDSDADFGDQPMLCVTEPVMTHSDQEDSTNEQETVDLLVNVPESADEWPVLSTGDLSVVEERENTEGPPPDIVPNTMSESVPMRNSNSSESDTETCVNNVMKTDNTGSSVMDNASQEQGLDKTIIDQLEEVSDTTVPDELGLNDSENNVASDLHISEETTGNAEEDGKGSEQTKDINDEDKKRTTSSSSEDEFIDTEEPIIGAVF